ncbi:gluconate 5-dehydrogenase [Yersinia enterocolitica]|nr:gluconate 5-dehydrogenase [Yersinia enterocolitica]PNM17365.1 gluconate 5-dehydrogenase [Yersinia enterocolitica]PNM21140.1 gluconate 5-dehydrogenase [Yersinia enterocolitica]
MRDDFTASLRSACFHRYGHFVINLKRRLAAFNIPHCVTNS